MHTKYNSPKSKSDFIRDIKYIWKILFPEKDNRGRIDDTIVPYPVRHLDPKMDKSREKARGDRLTNEEFERILDYFRNEPNIKAFLALALDSLARPQELLYLRIGDIELHENYAKIRLSQHGKEGLGILQCIDSFPFVMDWLNKHPFRDDPKAFLFVNLGNKAKYEQLKPCAINKKLTLACGKLKIRKPITCYSVKRNGVTFSRLLGLSDVEIQHKARWTSTKQLKIYDMSTQEDAFKMSLIRRGLIEADPTKPNIKPIMRVCVVCGHRNDVTDSICTNCKRPLDRQKIADQDLQNEMAEMNSIMLRELLKLLGENYSGKIFFKLEEKGFGNRLDQLKKNGSL